MLPKFCVGPANFALKLNGYAATTQSMAYRFFGRFTPRSGLATWSATLNASDTPVSHLGAKTLELGPVSEHGELDYPELPGSPDRQGAPRAILHGVMGLSAHFLRCRGDRLLHAAGRYLPDYGAIVAIGASGAGKSTVTSVLGGREMGDEGIALQWRENRLCAQASLVLGERLADFWEAKPIAALIVPAHEAKTSVTRLHGHEALIALANAVVRLRGDDLFDDFDWAHHALKQVPFFRVGWSLAQSPIEELKRALDATR